MKGLTQCAAKHQGDLLADEQTQLAIVIPAYKSEYLELTLESLSAQTDKRFNVYIGDDCSPCNLNHIVDKYASKIAITYVRFDTNMGGTDLVSQWMRCVKLIRNESWIWLFSDDDVMGDTCVKSFYECVSDDCDLFYFDTSIINEYGVVIAEHFRCDYETASDFLQNRYSRSVDSYVVEYIFRRSTFERAGGFCQFDLAWGADDGTWLTLSEKRGMRKLKNGRVYWRKSRQNISPDDSPKIAERKILAAMNYDSWIQQRFGYIHISVLARAVWFLESMIELRKGLGAHGAIDAWRAFCHKGKITFAPSVILALKCLGVKIVRKFEALAGR